MIKSKACSIQISKKYLDNKYQEIVNEREFSFETFWSSVGGFVGIFMGYSLLQIPELVAGLYSWCRNIRLRKHLNAGEEK